MYALLCITLKVTKEGLAARVVDRQQVSRTISREEMLHLFDFGDEENPEMVNQVNEHDMSVQVGETLNQTSSSVGSGCPSDKFMETLLSKHQPR